MAFDQPASALAGILRQVPADDAECLQVIRIGPGPYQIYQEDDAPLQQPRTVFIHRGMNTVDGTLA